MEQAGPLPLKTGTNVLSQAEAASVPFSFSRSTRDHVAVFWRPQILHWRARLCCQLFVVFTLVGLCCLGKERCLWLRSAVPKGQASALSLLGSRLVLLPLSPSGSVGFYCLRLRKPPASWVALVMSCCNASAGQSSLPNIYAACFWADALCSYLWVRRGFYRLHLRDPPASLVPGPTSCCNATRALGL